MNPTFPFGQPLKPVQQLNRSPKKAFVLGVYASAVHARWIDNKKGPLLYDCKNDPYEMKNLFGKKGYEEITQKLEQRLKKWIEDTDDPFETGQRDPKTGMLMLGQQFIHSKYLR